MLAGATLLTRLMLMTSTVRSFKEAAEEKK